MKYVLKKLIFFYVALFCFNLFAREELLPIGQIRDIGAIKAVKKEIESSEGIQEQDGSILQTPGLAPSLRQGFDGLTQDQRDLATDGLEGVGVKPEGMYVAKVPGPDKLGVAQVTVASEQAFLPQLFRKKFDLNLQGYIALEAFYDSRQVIGYKYNEYLFFPAAQKLDKTGLDINDKSQFNMLGVRSTLTLNIKGPELWNATPSAQIEGDFSGLADATVGLFRLKKAFAKLEWENSSVMFGQYYHPLCLDEVYPEVLSASRGKIYDPYIFSPQIKFRSRFDNFEFVAAIAKKYDSANARLAAMPDVFGQLNLFVGEHIFGTGICYHSEVPRLYSTGTSTATQIDAKSSGTTNNTYKTTEEVNSIYPFVFAKLHVHPFDIRLRATYAGNGNVYSFIGGYDVEARNERTDEKIYINTRTIACWADIIYNRMSRLEPAVFIGVSKNLGASKNIVKGYPTGLDENITNPDFLTLLQVENNTSGVDYTFIFAPRLRIKFGDLHLGAELEYNRASFAQPITDPGWETDFDCKGAVVCGTPVNNFRMLFTTFYNFDYNPFTRN